MKNIYSDDSTLLLTIISKNKDIAHSKISDYQHFLTSLFLWKWATYPASELLTAPPSENILHSKVCSSILINVQMTSAWSLMNESGNASVRNVCFWWIVNWSINKLFHIRGLHRQSLWSITILLYCFVREATFLHWLSLEMLTSATNLPWICADIQGQAVSPHLESKHNQDFSFC